MEDDARPEGEVVRRAPVDGDGHVYARPRERPVAREDRVVIELEEAQVDAAAEAHVYPAVDLTAKAFDTLLVLVRHSGRVLEKQELMRELWPDSFVEEANLNVQISALRKALGESPHERLYIITVPGRGYRFAAGVTPAGGEVDEIVVKERTRSRIVIEESEAEGEESVGEADALAAAPAARDVAARRGHRTRALVIAAVGAGLLSAAVAVLFFTRAGGPPPFERVQLSKLTTAGNATAAAVSPDSRHVAFVTSEAGAQRIGLRQTAADRAVEIYSAGDAGLGGLVFSPDGDYVYFLRAASRTSGGSRSTAARRGD